MNHTKLSLCALCLVLPMLASAQPTTFGTRSDSPEESVMSRTDKTLSPYFLIKSDDPTVDRLPLLSTKADVSIAGVIADVKVKQVYKNDGKKPIEAVYTFPASTRAAVYAMKMTIGDRTIVAQIREREKARQEYEQAKQHGQTASLLEQERPNVFQMNVANIMPGDFITVEMSYTELLVPSEGVYEFAYPTVVGPR
jgi:Ca-activated chloride channel family protein